MNTAVSPYIQSGDEGGDPFGPTEEGGALVFLKVEVDLLENVLGLEGDHAGLVFEFLKSVVELD